MGPAASPKPAHLVASKPVRRAYGSRTASASDSISAAPASRAQPGLDDVVSYLGEYQGVRMCWIVDFEGLPLAVWQRQQYSADADFWAPIAVESADFHAKRLSLGGPCRPERIEVRTDQGRLISEAVGDFWLGVLTDPDADDLIAVRLVRAREMIMNYLQDTGDRYAVAAEEHYV
jgi:predicted regulator of Ras-like GTPase activity (Roadblock/LC7/MglB family)